MTTPPAQCRGLAVSGARPDQRLLPHLVMDDPRPRRWPGRAQMARLALLVGATAAARLQSPASASSPTPAPRPAGCPTRQRLNHNGSV